MADHLVTLTADEEAALADQVARAQDPALTVDDLIAAILRQFLAPKVDSFLGAQREEVVQKLIAVDADTRQKLVDTVLQAEITLVPSGIRTP